MRFSKPAIILVTAAGVTAAAVGFSVPALADTPKPAATSSQITVKVDKANHEATVVTPKRGTFTVAWEPFKNGKADLVTVHNSKDQLVAARRVAADRVNKAVAAAEAHPGAVLKLAQERHDGKRWEQFKKNHPKAAAAAKAKAAKAKAAKSS